MISTYEFKCMAEKIEEFSKKSKYTMDIIKINMDSDKVYLKLYVHKANISIKAIYMTLIDALWVEKIN